MEGGKLPEALANCICIARMWEGQEGGAREIVRDTTVREMERLFAKVCIFFRTWKRCFGANGGAKRNEWGQFELLAAFQAYVMYVTLLMDPGAEPVVSQSIMRKSFFCSPYLSSLSQPFLYPPSHTLFNI